MHADTLVQAERTSVGFGRHTASLFPELVEPAERPVHHPSGDPAMSMRGFRRQLLDPALDLAVVVVGDQDADQLVTVEGERGDLPRERGDGA